MVHFDFSAHFCTIFTTVLHLNTYHLRCFAHTLLRPRSLCFFICEIVKFSGVSRTINFTPFCFFRPFIKQSRHLLEFSS